MNLENNIIDVNEADFTENVINKSEDKLVVVDFWAPWCGPCKQLTPTLEKIINSAQGKVLLAKINIDENQQIAAQLRIQSIPTVYAFKDKQIVNAFQGVIPENKIIEFIEKSLGSKINQNYEDFYKKISNDIQEGKIDESKEVLLEFISNPKRNNPPENIGATQLSSNLEKIDCVIKYIRGTTVTIVKYLLSTEICFHLKTFNKGLIAE